MTGVGAVLNRAKVEAGSSMAVFGLGGIGLSCVQGGVLAGAAKIIAIDVLPAKLELAKRLGATHVIDATRDDPVAAIRELTRGGADYAFEAVGNLKVIQQALDSIGAGGALTIVGVPKIGSRLDFVVHALYQNRRSSAPLRHGPPAERLRELADLYLGGRLKIDELITRRYVLRDFQTALDHLKQGERAPAWFTF